MDEINYDDLKSFIVGMPKTELHMHLEGSLEPDLAFSLAKRYEMLPLNIPKAEGGNYTVNTLADLQEVYRFNDLGSFLNVYNKLATCLRSRQDFKALAQAYCIRALAENVKHAEIFFDPQTHISRGLSFVDVVDGIQSGLDYGRWRGMSIKLQCSILRDHKLGLPIDSGDITARNGSNIVPSDPSAWSVVKMAVNYNKMVVPPVSRLMGLALDNNEMGYPPHLFRNIYTYARKNGMLNVAHAGEEGPASYIWECINNLKVIRIDHGVKSMDDPSLVNYLSIRQKTPEILEAYGKPHQVATTVCPLSNYKLKVFPDPSSTNILKMLDAGIMVTVNSDDPAYFGGYTVDNYMFLLQYLSKNNERPISMIDINRLCVNGFHASVLSTSRKAKLLAEVKKYFLTSAENLQL